MTIKLTDVEITVPDDIMPEKRAIELLGDGFLDKLEACFVTKDRPHVSGFVKIVHEGRTFYFGNA